MTKLQKAGLVLSALFAAIAGIAAVKLTGPSPVSAPVGGISFSWLPTLLTALGLGTTTSLPVLIPKIIGLLKTYAPKIFGLFGPPVAAEGEPAGLLSALLALGVALAALVRNRTDKAALRAFIFALVDAAEFIPHLDTSHDAGVVVLRFDAFADVPATKTVEAKVSA